MSHLFSFQSISLVRICPEINKSDILATVLAHCNGDPLSQCLRFPYFDLCKSIPMYAKPTKHVKFAPSIYLFIYFKSHQTNIYVLLMVRHFCREKPLECEGEENPAGMGSS